MPNYNDPIGKGGAWIKEGKKGKFMSGQMTFSYNGHSVTTTFLAFRNEKKTGQQPDYNILVTDSFPAKEKEVKKPEPKQETKNEENIPF